MNDGAYLIKLKDDNPAAELAGIKLENMIVIRGKCTIRRFNLYHVEWSKLSRQFELFSKDTDPRVKEPSQHAKHTCKKAY